MSGDLKILGGEPVVFGKLAKNRTITFYQERDGKWVWVSNFGPSEDRHRSYFVTRLLAFLRFPTASAVVRPRKVKVWTKRWKALRP